MKNRIYFLISLLLIGTQTVLAAPTESEIKTILQNRIDTEKRGVGIVVGLIDKNGRTIVSHGTFAKDGDKQNGLGIAVLSNTFHSVDDIGLHILNAQYKLSNPKAKNERVEIDLDPAVFDAYVGEYELIKNVIFTISREENRFFAQLTGQGKAEIFPESETKFFYKIVDAQITFFKNDEGQITHLVLHQNKVDQRAVKKGMTLESDKKEIKLSAEILDRYVGRYELQPGAYITITRENTQLKARVSGQPAIEIYPESETAFFYKVVDAQMDFHLDDTGKTTSLTLHQAGRNIPATKVE